MVKVNFDATINGNKAVAGVIFWNCHSKLMRDSVHILLEFPVHYAELHAAWMGLRIAILDLQAIEIWLERDDMRVVQEITDATLDNKSNNPVIQYVLIRKTGYHEFLLSRNYCEGKKATDFMVKMAL